MYTFINTTDKETAEQLKAMGYEVFFQDNEKYTFFNKPTLNFDLKDKVGLKMVTTNNICI